MSATGSALLSAGALLFADASADEPRAGSKRLSLALDPPRIEWRAAAAQERTDVVSLRNGGADVLAVRVSVEAFGLDEEGNVVSARHGGAHDAAEWIRVNPSTLQIEAGETASVRVTLRVPAGTPPGTAWALLVAESLSAGRGAGDEGRGLSLGLRLGCYLYAEIGKAAAPAVEAALAAAPAGESAGVTAVVTHRSGGILRLDARWRLLDGKGSLLREELVSFPLFPEARRVLQWRPPSSSAAQPARVELRIEGSGVKVSQTLEVAPPWKPDPE